MVIDSHYGILANHIQIAAINRFGIERLAYIGTGGIAVSGFFLTYPAWSMTAELSVWGTFVVVFPLVFFRYSRSLWLALELLFNPEL